MMAWDSVHMWEMGGKCVIEFIENFVWLVGGVIFIYTLNIMIWRKGKGGIRFGMSSWILTADKLIFI